MSIIKNMLNESADLQIKRIHSTECIGTSKKGDLKMSYKQLVVKLGQPDIHPSGSDVKVEWCFEATSSDDDPFIVSIYNNPRYYDHVKPEEMDMWNIGCKTPYQATLVTIMLKKNVFIS